MHFWVALPRNVFPVFLNCQFYPPVGFVRTKMVAVRTKISVCAHEDGAGKHGCAHEDREDGGVCARDLRAHRFDLAIWVNWVRHSADVRTENRSAQKF
jgi:hypothetical protein